MAGFSGLKAKWEISALPHSFIEGGDVLAKKTKNMNKSNSKSEKTAMSMPQIEQSSKSIRIPILTGKYIAAVLCVFVVLIMGGVFHYQGALRTTSAEKAELENLRKNNEAQSNQIEQLAKATVNLQADMERLNSLDAELRRIVNNEDTTNTSRAGLVRPPITSNERVEPQVQLDINDINNVVNNLQVAVKVREQSLIELKEELLAKQARLATRPSIWPTAGEVTSRFGWRSSPSGGGGRDYHPGIDIANSIGTPIVATADGQVIQSEWYAGYGETVQIDHGNSIVTLYGHNSQRLVRSGQMVKKGQIIAYLGNTGYSTGPHVHYEIRVNGTAVNPATFLN